LKDRKLYVGYTASFRRKLKEYKYSGSGSTKKRLPFHFTFYEVFVLEKDAKRREEYLKTIRGQRMLRLILKDSNA